MSLLILLAIGALIYMKFSGRIRVSWWVIGGIAVAALLLFTNVFSSLAFGLNSSTSDPSKRDACGCGPGQLVSVARRNMWGNLKSRGFVPCTVALNRVNNSSRWVALGCVN
jgi:hypothetical protein